MTPESYPCYDAPVWHLEEASVAAIEEQGLLPDIRIPQLSESTGPKIAVILAQDKHPARLQKDFTIHPSHIESVTAAGGHPIFLTYKRISEQLQKHRPDGILLLGGFFRSPKDWYLQPPAEDVDERGQAYLDTLVYAQNHRLPVLGICAGMQMLAGFCGAKMITDVKGHLVGHNQIVHPVQILPSSRLYEIAQAEEIGVNSYHKEAVAADFAGECLITARAPDGIVEAIEPKRPWNNFVLGLQWHPERGFAGTQNFRRNLFQTFIDACRR